MTASDPPAGPAPPPRGRAPRPARPIRERLDVWVVEAGHAPSRERAQALIRAGVVFVAGQRVDKPGTRVLTDATLEVRRDPCPYVSRGGLKLEAALDAFGVDPAGRVALDVGASTGGFTDCLLQRGALRVFAVDVGTNQLDYRLRVDDRVEAHERVNVRHWERDAPALVARVRQARPDLAVGDLSFISLTLILPAVDAVLDRPADAIFLIKPQFELSREEVGKGGVVRDEAARTRARDRVIAFAESRLGWRCEGAVDCPVHGAKGNAEWLAAFRVLPR